MPPTITIGSHSGEITPHQDHDTIPQSFNIIKTNVRNGSINTASAIKLLGIGFLYTTKISIGPLASCETLIAASIASLTFALGESFDLVFSRAYNTPSDGIHAPPTPHP